MRLTRGVCPAMIPYPAAGAAGTGPAARAASDWQKGAAGPPAASRVWLLAAVSLVLAANVMLSRYLFADSFYDLYAGRYILQHGIPRQNVVTSVAHGTPWVDQQWLAHVLYYLAWTAGGYRLLAALSAALVTSGFAVLALMMLHRGVPPSRAFTWTLAAFTVCLGNTGIRAQSFAYPCFALTLWLILEDDRAPRLRARTWLVVPLLVFWANTHGSALLGAGLVVLYAAWRAGKAFARRDRRSLPPYLVLATLAAASVVCTPYGVGVFRYYRSLIGNPVLTHNIVEWAPPSPLYPFSWAFFALTLVTVVTVVIVVRRGTRPDFFLGIVAVVLLALALTAVRNQAWFGLGGSLLAADTLARGGGRPPLPGKAFQWGITGILLALALASLGTLAVTPTSQFESLISSRAIDVAAETAAGNPAMRVLGDDYSGTAMLWLHPAMFGRVGFDTRFEQYPAAELGSYFDFLYVRGHRWQQVASGYGLIVVSRHWNSRLTGALAGLPGWRVVYQGRSGIVLERQGRP